MSSHIATVLSLGRYKALACLPCSFLPS